jgi:hypothetical protein
MDWRWRDVVLACIRIRNFDYAGIQDAVDCVQTGATLKARLPTTSRHIKPSDLRAEAEKLIADGVMPDLDSVLDAVGTYSGSELAASTRKCNGLKTASSNARCVRLYDFL